MMNRRQFQLAAGRFLPLVGMTALTACQIGSTGSTAAQVEIEPTPSAGAQEQLPLPIEEIDPTEIITLLPFDGIPAIYDPDFMTIQEAINGGVMEDGEPVLSFGHNGVWHAYSTLQLDGHEIVNDVVGGLPIAATW